MTKSESKKNFTPISLLGTEKEGGLNLHKTIFFYLTY